MSGREGLDDAHGSGATGAREGLRLVVVGGSGGVGIMLLRNDAEQCPCPLQVADAP